MSSHLTDEENDEELRRCMPPLQRSVTDWLSTDNVRHAAPTACSIIQKTPTAPTPSNYSGEITSLREEATNDAGRSQYKLGAIGAPCICMCRPVDRCRRQVPASPVTRLQHRR